jgi:hypothetical protein
MTSAKLGRLEISVYGTTDKTGYLDWDALDYGECAHSDFVSLDALETFANELLELVKRNRQ